MPPLDPLVFGMAGLGAFVLLLVWVIWRERRDVVPEFTGEVEREP